MSDLKTLFLNLPNMEKLRILYQQHLTEKDESEIISYYEFKKQVNPWVDNITPIEKLDFIQFGKLEEIKYYEFYKDSTVFNNVVEELKNFKISCWRRIIGNGNCFFTAIIVNYIEILLVLSIKEKQIDDFICFVTDVYFTDFENECLSEKKALMSLLLKLSSYIVSLNQTTESNGNDVKNYLTLDLFYRLYLKSEEIQNALIRWLKLKIKMYITLNCEENLNGISLIQSLPDYDIDQDNKNNKSYREKFLKSYFDNELMKESVFAEGIILYVTSLVFKLPIIIYHVDLSKIKREINSKNTNIKNVISEQIFDFESKRRGDINVVDNKNCLLADLDKSNKINLLFTDPHYDLIYNGNLSSSICEQLGVLSENYCIGNISNITSNLSYESTPNPDYMNNSKYNPMTMTKSSIIINQSNNSMFMPINTYKNYVNEINEIIRKYTLNLRLKLNEKDKQKYFNKQKEEWEKQKKLEEFKKQNEKNSNIIGNSSDFFLLKSVQNFNIEDKLDKNSNVNVNINKYDQNCYENKNDSNHVSFINPNDDISKNNVVKNLSKESIESNERLGRSSNNQSKDYSNEKEKNKGRYSSSVVKNGNEVNERIKSSVIGHENSINNSQIINKVSKEYDINSYDKNELNKIIGIKNVEKTLCCKCYNESDSLKFKCNHEYCFKCFEILLKEIYKIYEKYEYKCPKFDMKNEILIGKILKFSKTNIRGVPCLNNERKCDYLDINLIVKYYESYVNKFIITPSNEISNINSIQNSFNNQKSLLDSKNTYNNQGNQNFLNNSLVINKINSNMSNNSNKIDSLVSKDYLFNSNISAMNKLDKSLTNSSVIDKKNSNILSTSNYTTAEEIIKSKLSDLINYLTKTRDIEKSYIQSTKCKICQSNVHVKLDCCVREKCVKCLCDMFNKQIEKLTNKTNFMVKFKINNNELFDLSSCSNCNRPINNKFLEILKVDKRKEFNSLKKLMDTVTKI